MPAAGAALATACLRLCGVCFRDACGGGSPTAIADFAGTGDFAGSADFSGTAGDQPEPWGWTDGRGSLALPLWLASHPTARAVVCIRHPLESAVSMRDRHGSSLAVGLSLWQTYANAILDSTSPDRRVIAHFAAFRRDAAAETARVAAALGLAPPPAAVEACRQAWRPTRSPARFTMADLVDCGADPAVVAAYRRLCAEAAHADDDDSVRPDRLVLRDCAEACRRQPSSEAVESADLSRDVALLQTDVALLRAELASRDGAMQELLEDLRHDFEDDHVPPQKRLYRQTIRRIRDLVRTHVPPDGIVAIVSKGDEELVRQRSCTGWHFPSDDQRHYLGYHPAGDLAAIANLETLRARGATHFLVPETHAWWLTSYPGLTRHLDRHARLVESRSGAGVLYDLAPLEDRPAAIDERLARALGRPPQVLDWKTARAAAVFPAAHVFPAPAAEGGLPYIDGSIDVVAVANPSPADQAEARRVASIAVVDIAGEPAVDWIRRPVVAEPPSVSIVLPVCNHWPVTAACLRALLPSLPSDWPVEVIVVDDASTDETPLRLEGLAAADHRLVILRNDNNLGFVGTCNRGAAAATGDVLVFLNNDTVPLPGWLPPLVTTFAEFPGVGAVGGKLLFPDGRMQEAGGIIFADGSACHFGREHPDPSWRLFNHVRPVDYVSGALLATPRELFAACGGFDPDFAPGYYEDTDYCFRLRDLGYDVLFQPASVVVHVEGGTAGTDHAVGMKRFQEANRRRFQARHAVALMGQRPRPSVIDRGSWAELAHRGPVPGPA